MIKNDYAFAVAVIRSKEKNLLTAEEIMKLAHTDSFETAVSFLKSKNWAVDSGNTSEIIKAQEKTLSDLIFQLVDDENELLLFTVLNDFFNIKAAIKGYFSNTEIKSLFRYPTSIDLEKLDKAVESHDFSLIDEKYRSCAKEAFEVANETKSGMNVEIILDCGALRLLRELIRKKENDLVFQASDFFIAATDLKIGYRCSCFEKNLSFCRKALGETTLFSSDELAKAASEGTQSFFEFVKKTPLSECVEILKQSYSDFEIWVERHLLTQIKKSKFIFLGFDPIYTYYLAARSEIKSVKLILSAKENGISSETVKERVSALYE
ncbi:MAG: V-type ATPase subunit [Clostridia bacterium]|nr:V-type ATPase subunit [Clostridia bacterium]